MQKAKSVPLAVEEEPLEFPEPKLSTRVHLSHRQAMDDDRPWSQQVADSKTSKTAMELHDKESRYGACLQKHFSKDSGEVATYFDLAAYQSMERI
ncbi:unnamed protein product [Prunus brigantina]